MSKSKIDWQEVFEKIENEGLDYWIENYSNDVCKAYPQAKQCIDFYFKGKIGMLSFLEDRADENGLEFDRDCI